MTRHITNEGALTSSARVNFFSMKKLYRRQESLSLSFFLSLLMCDRGYEGLQV